MNRLRKTFAYLLAVSIIAASFPMTSLAEKEIEQAAAITMKLRKTEGTVKIADKNKKAVSVFKDMRLYNGYRIETQKKSYGWIDLDSSKLIKLDADSRTIIQKNGKELDIVLEKGKLFFDVAEPLADDEKMNIRTSTTAVGIRGTCGWIEVAGKEETKVSILEGSVQAAVINPATGDVKVGSVSGGGTVTCVAYESKTSDDKCGIISERFTEKDVPGFVVVDIVNDKDLAEKIFEKSKAELDLRNMTKSDAQERLYIEEKAAEKSSQQSNTASDSESSGTSESYDSPAPSAPAPPQTTVALSAEGLTVKKIEEHLGRYESVTVNGDFTVDSNLTVPKGRTLTFNSPVQVADGASVTVNGTIKADNTISGSVFLNAGGHAFAKIPGGAMPNLVLDVNGFMLEDNAKANEERWTDNNDGYSRYEYIAYKLDNGTLTIVGSGKMKDYWRSSYYRQPWKDNCAEINNVEIGEGVISIGDGAFYNCSSLTSITIPDSVTSIGNVAFANCSSLKSITIPDSVTSIGRSAFYSCSSLKSLTIPKNSMTSINTYTFKDCSSLESITILGGVITIDTYAFYNCSSLKSVTILDGLTTIDTYAFYNCSSLKSITMPNSVTNINTYAFYGCSSLESITIPNSVTFIDVYAFYGCSGLKSVTIPNSVDYVDFGAFYGCSSLTSITIPDSVTYIDFSAFEGCSSLEAINVDKNNAVYYSVEGVLFEKNAYTLLIYPSGKKASSYIIPSDVTIIGDGAFYGCSSLMSVEIPSSVTSIGYDAFSGCTNLTQIIYNGTTAQLAAIEGIDNIGFNKENITCVAPAAFSLEPDAEIALAAELAPITDEGEEITAIMEITENQKEEEEDENPATPGNTASPEDTAPAESTKSDDSSEETSVESTTEETSGSEASGTEPTTEETSGSEKTNVEPIDTNSSELPAETET